MRYEYVIQIPLIGQFDQWYDLCVCQSPTAAMAIVTPLLEQAAGQYAAVRIAVRLMV